MHYRTTALNSTTASKIRQKYANSCKMQIYFLDNGHLYFCLIEFSFFHLLVVSLMFSVIFAANIVVSTKISFFGVHSCHINPVLEKKLNVLYKFFFADKNGRNTKFRRRLWLSRYLEQ